MEKEQKLVKVYSNNSKKARIKRDKRKFQRVWSAEKQTYVKVRKHKARIKSKRVDWRTKIDCSAIKRRQETPKEKKVSVQKPITQQVRKEPARVQAIKKSTVTKIHGINYTWDSKALHYKKAA